MIQHFLGLSANGEKVSDFSLRRVFDLSFQIYSVGSQVKSDTFWGLLPEKVSDFSFLKVSEFTFQKVSDHRLGLAKVKKCCVSSEKTCQKVSDFSFQKVLDFTFQKVSDHRSDPTLFGPKKRRIFTFQKVSDARSIRHFIFLGSEVEEVSDFAFKKCPI